MNQVGVKLRHLAGRLEQVREEERTFLARELHDDLGQSLTAIKMNLSWLSTHPAAPDPPD
jgi:signal transduction histidine kinase